MIDHNHLKLAKSFETMTDLDVPCTAGNKFAAKIFLIMSDESICYF